MKIASDPNFSVVVTGAAGGLGAPVVKALLRRGIGVRGLGRSAAPAGFPAPWTRADLLSGDGLSAAFGGMDVVVHAASDPFAKGADVQAARRLSLAAREAGISHIVYVQIAGITDAAKVYPYYRDKLSAEQALREGAVPCSAASATQFHGLVDRVLATMSIGPALFLPKFTLQPVDVGFFADRIADHLFRLDPEGVTVCGPEALTSREMAVAWLAARRRRRLLIPFPSLGPLAGFARIRRVTGVSGGRTWEEWSRDTSGGVQAAEVV